jgi:glycosyltransferase involved in cell wall biosynthesis
MKIQTYNDIPLVSVIIPIYNAEKYLLHCLNSVCQQTLRDIEIICIDDASDDNSLTVLQNYAAKDLRLTIITHDKNYGQATARNTGIKAAKGKYIYFIDNDDWIDIDYIASIVYAAKVNNADVVVNTNIIIEFEDGRSEYYYDLKKLYIAGFNKIGFIKIEDDFFEYICCAVWSFLWKKSFINKFKLAFLDGLSHEDLFFSRIALVNLQNIYITNKSSYHWLNRTNSVGKQRIILKKHIFDVIEVVEKIYYYYLQNHLLDKFKICFFEIKRRFNFFIPHADIGFTKVKTLFNKMFNDVKSRLYMYSEEECEFFDAIILCHDIVDFRKIYFKSTVVVLRNSIITRSLYQK